VKRTPSLGPGVLLVAVYGIFAISASARAIFQIATKFSEAPLAYSLSALAAVVYLLAAWSLARPKTHRLAALAVWFELIGVLLVGILSFSAPELFAHPSVWSGFGVGYGYIPLILPVLGLFWLRYRSARNQ
jgi:uncharacterized membrane protein YhdT